MRHSLLDILVCPECRNSLALEETLARDGRVETGTLHCGQCAATYPIRTGIPRFVSSHPADLSFGFQWNTFRKEQLDSATGVNISAERLWSETGWPEKDLGGKRVLDVGCGAGRFLEVIAAADCDVVGMDVTSAIDAAALTVKDRRNVDLVQADVYKMPFRDGSFDGCYCIGVAQHTPNPMKTLRALPSLLRPGGKIAVTVYERPQNTPARHRRALARGHLRVETVRPEAAAIHAAGSRHSRVGRPEPL